MNTASTIVQKIVITLRKEITNGILKSGAHLTETSVSKNFNVSRVPVREAFRILQSEGYIDLIHNRGGFVKSVSRDNAIENGEIYVLLVPMILKKAIPNYTKSTFKKAHAILDKIENCEKYCDSSYLVWDFAKVIYSPSKMELSMKIINDIYSQGIRALNDYFEIEDTTKVTIDSHREFVNLCEIKKFDEAVELWINHVEHVKERIINSLPD
ncbi:MAG TPA: GntR family transcriptional regulator [Ignavibacteria bacterium]|nr:GntR family transcriptional regulator [Ignavibacteria bacterium]